MNSVKALLTESPDLKTIPSIYAYSSNSKELVALDTYDSIPTIDFSLLTCDDPVIRFQVIQDLGNACNDWGFFQVINHGVPETLMKMVIEKSHGFFNLTEKEKKDFEGKDVFDPIKYGTSFNNKKDEVIYWRDYLKINLHPEFHCPNKPLGLREVFFEYSKRAREVANGLLSGISTSLGLDQTYVKKALNLDTGSQMCVINLYPPCPQPELAIGLPPHSDYGLFTLLINNGVGGLQIKHKGKWINIHNTLPNSLLINTGDQLEVFSNGKYKSVEHRAVLNNVVTKISVVIAYGPTLDTVVAPADKLMDEERCPAAYAPMKYKDYIEMQQRGQLVRKSCLERVRA
uniref:2-oxoglutarate-dependent dioxygenase 19-like n=1 Tax=Erigeron canadensis TaxID=72917 RepID=UPI001CB9B45D|nr:2-oxoglutarate-dependent dioxygenase 19-like [Erigeron canadensis]